MDSFKAHSLYWILRQLEIFEGGLMDASPNDPGRKLTEQETADVNSALGFAKDELNAAQLFEMSEKAERNLISISIDPHSNASSVSALLRELRLDIDRAVEARKFVLIRPDRSEYACADRLFGDRVYEKFPAARVDVTEAGNCLAIEDGTGAVFHLMRAAEYGLRALAYDREVVVPKGPIDLATWDDILRQLEHQERAIEGFPRTHARECQLAFYHGAMIELRSFKNAFRNRVMHTREDFDRDQAKSVMTHVGEFMRLLASNITEGERTPRIWDDATVVVDKNPSLEFDRNRHLDGTKI